MNSLTSNLLQQTIGKKIDSLYSQRGQYSVLFQSYSGYGSLIMTFANDEPFELKFYSKEDERYRSEIHDLELNIIEEHRKKSWLPGYWGKSHSFSISVLGVEFTLKKIFVYGAKGYTENIALDTDFLIVLESETEQRILIKSDGVFDGEYRIDFNEIEIKNHFDLKREDDSDFYILKKIIE